MHAVKYIHNDEEGIETLQAVMIVALGAAILAVVKIYYPDIKDYFQKGCTFRKVINPKRDRCRNL